MAINLAGEFATPRGQDEVFDFLSDPHEFGPLLPDFQSMSMQGLTHFTVKVRVEVGKIRGSVELKMELSEAVKPKRAQYKGRGSAVGSQITVSAGFDLSSAPEGTKVAWQGEANISGKLASMAGGMLEPLAHQNIQKLIDGLQMALAQPLATCAETPAGTENFPHTGTGPALSLTSPAATAQTDERNSPGVAPNSSPTNSDSSAGAASALTGTSTLKIETLAPPGEHGNGG